MRENFEIISPIEDVVLLKIMKTEPKFAVCIENKTYPASLEFGKIYRVIEDEKAAAHKMIRIIDESGEDYLYTEKSFVPIKLPQTPKRLLWL